MVKTRVIRIAPEKAGFSMEIPLLEGEKLLTPGMESHDGRVTVSLPTGAEEAGWNSRLERLDQLKLVAGPLDSFSEIWKITVSPQWRAVFSGVPPSLPEEAGDYWVHEFHPLPSEMLNIEISRPEAVSGATLAIDAVSLRTSVGPRVREHRLELDLRCTRGGRHELTLGDDIELLSVTRDDEKLNLRLEDRKLLLPVHPGGQHYEIRWREKRKIGILLRTPAVDLGVKSSNLKLQIDMPANRWILGVSGPLIGPAVLYWSELLLMGLLAFLLARVGPPAIRLHQWLILGLGFSVFSWAALVFIVVWLLLLHVRGKLEKDLSWWRFDLLQVFLAALTLAAILCFFVAVPFGLLGSPDMHIEGNASSGHTLRWFADAIAMLAWALWLAGTLLSWLKWAWECWSHGGWWKAFPHRKKSS